MTYKLVLLRHGESEWNAKNLFTGWVDVPLSDKGRAEATHGGELLKESGVLPDLLFTSMLRRAIMTANLALDAADRHWIPVERNWRLNERHYGALQGKNKKEIRDEYGEEQFMLWRRSFDVAPPAIEVGSEFSQDQDPRYAGEPVPMSECLKDVIARLLPYWDEAIVPAIKTGKTVMIAAHGNSLRAIVKHLDEISDEDIAGVNIPTGIPLVYELDEEPLKPIKKGGTYLDPEAEAKIAAVANQGKGAERSPGLVSWTRPGLRHARGCGSRAASEDRSQGVLAAVGGARGAGEKPACVRSSHTVVDSLNLTS